MLARATKEEQNKVVMKHLTGLYPRLYFLLCIFALVVVLLVSASLVFRLLYPTAGNPLIPITPIKASRLVKDLDSGNFLVARRGLPDPNFAETVILLTHYDDEQAMGLIINRSTRIPLSQLFEDLEAAQRSEETVYIGGPVALGGILALLRSPTRLDAVNVLNDVYLISSIELLDKAIAAETDSGTLRIYLGYSGWGAGQLEREVELGMWYIFTGDAEMVFDSDPDSLWSRLVSQTELRMVKALPSPPLIGSFMYETP